MFKRKYTVKGEDVNDFMVMQNAAYLKYASKIVETFLFVNGFTSLKMNKSKVGLQKSNDQIKHLKNLMFTKPFSVELVCKEIGLCQQKMSVEVYFYNEKEELSTKVIRELFWFDYTTWQALTPPKVIAKHFLQQERFKRVG
ncbi:hypothetical protein BTO07_07115 [Polaribacter sp. SA4-12]|nr:hypothetical protein BTO07_07115 [Polaribacter sp. SA4-12]